MVIHGQPYPIGFWYIVCEGWFSQAMAKNMINKTCG